MFLHVPADSGTAGNADNMIYGSEGVASIKAINGGTRIVDADGKVIYRERGTLGWLTAKSTRI